VRLRALPPLVPPLVLALLSACSVGEGVSGLGPRPSLDVSGYGSCTLNDPVQCGQIAQGIVVLKGHGNPVCKSLGEKAEEMYNSTQPGVGFMEGGPAPANDPNRNMGVPMKENTLGQQSSNSGWHATQEAVLVHPPTWTGPAASSTLSMAGLVAHEMTHIIGDDGDHNTGMAGLNQDICGGPG
jgi:hypothetical protein